MKLPKNTGFIDIKIGDYLEDIFDLDVATCKATPNILPLETKEELLNFLEVEHKTKSFILNDESSNCVGYLSYIETPDSEGRVELLNLMIHPDFWRKGHGTTMVKHYQDMMRNLGMTQSKLVTSPDNTSAQNFYKSLGYKEIAVIKDYYGPGEDRVLMVCDL